jgi:hypothetical protein
MRVRNGIVILVPDLAVTAAGCGAPPIADIDAAKTSVTNAVAAGARDHAAPSLKAAEDAQAALDAVNQWESTPTRLNGAPVPVVMTVTVNFRLQ